MTDPTLAGIEETLLSIDQELTRRLIASDPDLTDAQAQLDEIEREITRRRWAADPAAWAKEKLGDTLWSGQIDILNSVRDHRKTAAATCHEIGKSYDAAIVAAWWLDIHKPGEAYVVTTAPTGVQVKAILWKEIGRAHSRGNLPGRVNQTEWKMDVTDARTGITKEETVAMGRKPSDYAPTAFQGIHAPYVLVLVDEANGVRGLLWDAIDSIMANDTAKMLEIGNPDDPSGEFYDHCKPGSGYNVIHISAFDSPNFTGEPLPPQILRQLIGRTYVEERRVKWASSWTWVDAQGQPSDKDHGVRCVMPADGKLEDTHPFWQSKVLGQFPVQTAEGTLIALSWIRAAQERTLQPGMPNELALDVGASVAGDPSCLGHRRGQVFRILYEERQPDTMKTAGKLIQYLGDRRYGAVLAKVDYIGVGRGVVDRAREQGLPVFPIQVGEASTILSCVICKHEWDQARYATKHQANAARRCPNCNSDIVKPVFADLLSQLMWNLRGVFERGEVDIDANDEELADQLLMMTWEPNSQGQIKVKYIDGPSPNRADAMMLAFAPVPEAPPTEFATW